MDDERTRAVDGCRVIDMSAYRCRLEWITLEVQAATWWEIVDHPEAVKRGLDGWVFSSCVPSPDGNATVVFTFYRRRHNGRKGWARRR